MCILNKHCHAAQLQCERAVGTEGAAWLIGSGQGSTGWVEGYDRKEWAEGSTWAELGLVQAYLRLVNIRSIYHRIQS